MTSEMDLRDMAVVNVASVPQRSPFRYPGGKTWFVPMLRCWLASLPSRPSEFCEPFAGGGIAGLTVAFENLADTVTLVELDEDVASVWTTILDGESQWLCDRILSFDMTVDNVEAVLNRSAESLRERAFATILRNRVNRGGIMAPGAGRVRNGENGKGLTSRWYPQTLSRRIKEIARHRDRIELVRGDGLDVMARKMHDPGAAFFVDPPYTVAGRRLYVHNEIDHDRLFALVSELCGNAILTYDDAPEIRKLAARHGLDTGEIPMKTTHHLRKVELVIGKNLSWLVPATPTLQQAFAESGPRTPS